MSPESTSSGDTHTELKALEAFDRATLRAFWRKVGSRFTGARNDLLPFDEVRSRLPVRGQRYLGLRQVPIDRIVGSVGRYRDFDRAFFPTQSTTKYRWVSVSKARYTDVALPPVDLYQIGDVYFVKDGNHRISVARERGQDFVDANVTEIAVPVPVSPDADLDELALAQERSRFFETTGLDRLRPEARIEASVPGHYDELLEHISAHRWYLGQQRGRHVAYEEAVGSWYDDIYRPLVDMLREHGVLDSGPDRAEADFYLWIVQYQEYLRRAPYDDVPGKKARRRLLKHHPDAAVRRLARALSRSEGLAERLLAEEYARFLEQTGLATLRPEADLRSTLPQCYARLAEHISTHRWFLGEERGAEVPYGDAATSWYDRVYLPLVEIVREQGILEHFPQRTETDLYLWILERQGYLRERQGVELSLQETAEQVAGEHDQVDPPVRRVLRALKGAARRSPTDEGR